MPVSEVKEPFLKDLERHGKYTEVYLVVWIDNVLIKESKLIDYKYCYYKDGVFKREKCDRRALYDDFLDGLSLLLTPRNTLKYTRVKFKSTPVKRRRITQHQKPYSSQILKKLLTNETIV